MKSLKMIIAATVLGSVSFGSMAATLLTKEDLDKNPGKYEKIGTVTTTAQTTRRWMPRMSCPNWRTKRAVNTT